MKFKDIVEVLVVVAIFIVLFMLLVLSSLYKGKYGKYDYPISTTEIYARTIPAATVSPIIKYSTVDSFYRGK